MATIQAALEAGANLLDTGDFYGSGHNEELIGTAIRDRRELAVLSVKFGALQEPGGALIVFDARPASVKSFLTYTLRRLGTDYVDIYRPARVDPTVPIEETVGAIADLIRAGYVRQLGLSEAGVETIRRAHAIQPVVDLQIEYSLRNLAVVAAVADLARKLDATPARVAVAWALQRGVDIVPLVGARRPERLAEALGALTIRLGTAAIERLEAAVPATGVAGERYDAHGMRMLDSEGRPGA